MWRRDGDRYCPGFSRTPPSTRVSLRAPGRRDWRGYRRRADGRAGYEQRRSTSLAMGHNGSWISRNASEPRNGSGAEAASANRSALGEFGEAQLYRQFTTTVQVVIFIGSLLGKLSLGAPPREGLFPEDTGSHLFSVWQS